MNLLIEQERALHKYEVRTNLEEIKRLIHPDFIEVGKSGDTYYFKDMIESMVSEEPPEGYIHSQDFELIQLEASVQLLLYKTVWVSLDGDKSSFAKRSSIWVFTGQSWQLKYHQGTPCLEFEIRI